jgi:CubicO group peptidase (beta-lactamase class C family)
MTGQVPSTIAMRRRELLRLGAIAGLGIGLAPRLAWAGDRPDLMAKEEEVIARWVGPGKFPGMVAALGVPGKGTQFAVRGTESFTDLDVLTPDSLFRIYSMTKPITGMAAMMLIDEGKLGLDQPLAEILPQFATMNVQVVPDSSITDVRPAKAQITIRNLLTHTSGLGYAIIQKGPLRKAMMDAGLGAGRISRTPIPGLETGKSVTSLAEFADKLATLPLVYEPATKWSYSLGLDLMGRVIEVVSGIPFDRFLQQRILDPVGMTSTWFQVPASEAPRLTTNFGALGMTLFPIDPGATSIYLDKPPAPFGGSGLVSSPRDYDRFLAMLANLGIAGKVRVMSERAVRVGTGNLLPAGVGGPITNTGQPSDFGAGGRVGKGAEQGIFGWAGAAGTVGAVDMRSGIRTGIYAQFMPPNSNNLLSEYQTALHQDVTALMGGKS